MKKNVGPLDARIRIVVGIVLGILAVLSFLEYVTVPYVSHVGLGIWAVVLVVEGALNRCLLYRLLGIDRCPVNRSG